MKKVKEFYNVRENDKETFERMYVIEMAQKEFERTESGKSWRKNPSTEENKVITFDEYFNYLSSVGFFKNLGGSERVEKGYTMAGYIPTNMTSIDPDKTIKVVRTFKIDRKDY